MRREKTLQNGDTPVEGTLLQSRNPGTYPTWILRSMMRLLLVAAFSVRLVQQLISDIGLLDRRAKWKWVQGRIT